ncbi:MAG: Hsp20/alpha crystallin family protein [Candidatus Omnitrophota bacterium]|nr:MAG: Hsp20/alpha crystallin family protein [Candidatus Omnitrophota bacterium]
MTGNPTLSRRISDLRREFDSLLDRFFRDDWLAPEAAGVGSFVPAFDVSETETEFLVKAELPGVDPKDVEVNLSGNVLTVKGEKKQEREEKTESLYRVERSYGSFSRSFSLPSDVKADQVSATYKDGVLNLKLPKTEPSKRKTIKIDVT